MDIYYKDKTFYVNNITDINIEKRYKDEIVKEMDRIYTEVLENVNMHGTSKAKRAAKRKSEEYAHSCKDPYKYCLVIDKNVITEFKDKEFANMVYERIHYAFFNNYCYLVPDEDFYKKIDDEKEKFFSSEIIKIPITFNSDENKVQYQNHLNDDNFINDIKNNKKYCEIVNMYPMNLSPEDRSSPPFLWSYKYPREIKYVSEVLNFDKDSVTVKFRENCVIFKHIFFDSIRGGALKIYFDYSIGFYFMRW